MKRQFVYFVAVFALLTLTFGPRPAHAGNAVVGAGTPASCTEAAFDTALASVQADSYGGVLTFNCGGAPHTIEIFASATIVTSVEIDGGDLITLFAQGTSPSFTKPRFFEVVERGHLTLRSIKLEGGRSPAGAGWGSQGGSIVVWDDTNDADPYEYASLNLHNVSISNSASSAWGGAIANEGGIVRIENSYLAGSARWGGAYNGALGVDTFIGTTISGSTSTEGGGGLRFWSSLNSQVIDSTVSQNSTQGAGGGIENVGGNLTVQNSYVERNSAGSWGGGIKNSYNGDTSTHAVLTVENSSIAENQATENGGGIDSNDTLTVRDSTLRQNTAKRGGGVTNWGGQMALVGASFDRNSAENGGGIYQHAGGASVTGANISGNSATVDGGGLYLDHILGADASNWVKIAASKLIGNSANAAGGAILASTAYLTIDNSEIANSSGAAVYLWKNASDIVGSYLLMTKSSIHDNPGGGIFNGYGTLLIANSTVSQNTGWGVWAGLNSITTDLGFATLRGNTSGQLQRTGGNLELTNSVLDSGGVAAANCSTSGGLSAPTVTGTWSSDGSCGSGPIVSSSLLLGPLALNGGATPNHMPQSGSAVINQAGCGSYTRDQRGAARPGTGSTFCDAGAVETGGLFPRVYLPSIVR